MKSWVKVAAIAVAVVIVAVALFVSLTPMAAATSNLLDCQGAQTNTIVYISVYVTNHTVTAFSLSSAGVTVTRTLQTTNFTTTTNSSAPVGRVVTTTTTFTNSNTWMVATCTFTK